MHHRVVTCLGHDKGHAVCPENTHSSPLASQCVVLHLKVCMSDRPFKGNGKQQRAQPLLGVLRGNKDCAESRSQAGPNGSVTL